MVILVSFSFKYILIAYQRIPVIHIPQLLNQLVHNLVVPKLLLINHICLLFDESVIAQAIGQPELIIVLDLWDF